MKDKKFVIGALLAILIVMAVGYSAFSTVLSQLTVLLALIQIGMWHLILQKQVV